MINCTIVTPKGLLIKTTTVVNKVTFSKGFLFYIGVIFLAKSYTLSFEIALQNFGGKGLTLEDLQLVGYL